MATGQLPAARGTCRHGLRLPSALQVGFIYGCIAHKDYGTAIAVCVDWCDICTGLIDEPETSDS